MSKIILIYWDQLSENLTALKAFSKHDTILFVECIEQCTYVKHHKKKLVFLIAAMRAFAKQLKTKGYPVEYVALDDSAGLNTVNKSVTALCKKKNTNQLVITQPGEFHQLVSIKKLAKQLNLKLTMLEDDRFICTKKQFATWVGKNKSDKNLLMESFYREIRKMTGLLMQDNKPEGGKWNFDKDNRSAIPKEVGIPTVEGFKLTKQIKEVADLVEAYFPDHFGDIQPFWYGITAKQAKIALNRFVNTILPNFGKFQDAMLEGEAFLFHSVLSQYINVGLLDPLEVCHRVEHEYYQGNITLACAEGFIRQIIGWREYIRGIYWHFMPEYKSKNFLNYQRKLPDLYWGKKTHMQCLSHTISQTKIHAYSHHIQRLMVTGNFAALIGVHPNLIHEWYLIVYMDAFEWVEMPNTLGMATFSDGGIVGTKPYISSGNYIHKMSNFCQKCVYQVKLKNGPEACPFNYLYWNYLLVHHEQLKTNHRLRMPFNTLQKMSKQRIKDIQQDSTIFLDKIEQGKTV